MKIVKLIPQGFCYGVYHAYEQTKKILAQNKDHKVYILGWLVHNQNVINELTKMGAIILDDKNTSRYELVRSLEDHSIVILSAHGTDHRVIDLMKQKSITYYDLTCKYVYKTHDLIKEKIKEGYSVLFIGKQNHPETKAILALSDKINLIETAEQVTQLTYSNQTKYFCTNQTTLGIYDYYKITKKLKEEVINLEVENDICDATTMRQEAIIKNNIPAKICLVIGDERSSNCNELVKIAKTKYEVVYRINDLSELKENWFKPTDVVAITAAASTPKKIIDEITNYLENLR